MHPSVGIQSTPGGQVPEYDAGKGAGEKRHGASQFPPQGQEKAPSTPLEHCLLADPSTPFLRRHTLSSLTVSPCARCVHGLSWPGQERGKKGRHGVPRRVATFGEKGGGRTPPSSEVNGRRHHAVRSRHVSEHAGATWTRQGTRRQRSGDANADSSLPPRVSGQTTPLRLHRERGTGTALGLPGP